MSKPPNGKPHRRLRPTKARELFAGFLPIMRLKWPLALDNTRARILRACALSFVAWCHISTALSPLRGKFVFQSVKSSVFDISCQNAQKRG